MIMRFFNSFSKHLGSAATASLLICSHPSQAFAQRASSSIITGVGLVSSSKVSFVTNILDTSSSSSSKTTLKQQQQFVHSLSSSRREMSILPEAISVQPGTSPVESQQSLNPIDDTCTVLVVGATRGIGLEFVQSIIRRGATVVATYRKDEDTSSLTSPLRQLKDENPSSVYLLKMDVGDENSIRNAALELKSKMEQEEDGVNFKGLTHIIHSAGIYLPGTSFDGTARGPRKATPPVTKEAMMKTFEINSVAPMLVAQNFVPLMRKRSDILLPVLSFLTSKVGSVDDNGSGGAYAYRSSKSALNNIAKSLSIDLAGDVSVILLHPGYVRTDMTSGAGLIDASESVEGMLKAVEATDATVGFRFVDYKACLIPW